MSQRPLLPGEKTTLTITKEGWAFLQTEDGIAYSAKKCRKCQIYKSEYFGFYAQKRGEKWGKTASECKECFKEHWEHWAKENPERAKEVRKASGARNKEKRNARRKEKRQAKRKHVLQSREWNRTHPERRKTFEARRRARKLNVLAEDHPIIDAIYEEATNPTRKVICYLCDQPIGKDEERHVDHVVALAANGPHAAYNLRIAHASCNARKGKRSANTIAKQMVLEFGRPPKIPEPIR